MASSAITVEELEIIITTRVEKALGNLDALRNKIREIQEMARSAMSGASGKGNPVDAVVKNAKRSVDDMKADLTSLNEKIQEAARRYEKMKGMVGQAANRTDIHPDTFANMQKWTQEAKAELEEMMRRAEEMAAAIRESENASEEMKEAVSETKKEVGETTDATKELTETTKETTEETKKYRQEVERTSKSTKTSFTKIGALFKRLFLWGTLRRAIGAMRNALGEGLQNIARDSEKANAIMSQYSTSFMYLKNSVASSLLPILDTVSPYIMKIVDKLAEGFDYASALMSALAGKNTYTRAVKVQQDYSGAVADTTKEVNKLGKASAALTGIEELNILSFEKASDVLNDLANSDTTKNMFEEVTIPGGIKETADYIRNNILPVLDDVLKIAALIGAAFLAWKIATEITDFITGVRAAGGIAKYLFGADVNKAGVMAATLIVEFGLVFDAAREIASGKGDFMSIVKALLGTAIGTVGAIIATGSVASGIGIGISVALIATVVGMAFGFQDNIKKLVNDAFFNGEGVPIDDIITAFKNKWASVVAEKKIILGLAAEIELNDTKIADLQTKIQSVVTTLSVQGIDVKKEIDKIKGYFAELHDAINENLTNSEKIITTALAGALSRTAPEVQEGIAGVMVEVTRVTAEQRARLNELKGTIDELTESLAGAEQGSFEYTDYLKKLTDATLDYYREAGIATDATEAARLEWDKTVTAWRENGIDFGGDIESAKAKVKEFGDTGAEILNTISEAHRIVSETIEGYIQSATDRGALEEIKLWENVKEILNEDYQKQKSTIENDITTAFDDMQLHMVAEIGTVHGAAEKEWSNLGWVEKGFHKDNVANYTSKAMAEYKKNVVNVLSEDIKGQYETLGIDGTVWASDATGKTLTSLFDVRGAGIGQMSTSYRNNVAGAIKDGLEGAGQDIDAISKRLGSDSVIKVLDGAKASLEQHKAGYENLFWSTGQTIGTAFANGITNAIGKIDLATHAKQTLQNGQISPEVMKIMGFASGGFPEMGQMFIARESGPELVGTIGGHAAVANNDQIVSGIKAGVYEAMMKAGGGGGDITIQIVNDSGEVTSETIISALDRKNRRDGNIVVPVH
jgi:Chromosome segregation ATPases